MKAASFHLDGMCAPHSKMIAQRLHVIGGIVLTMIKNDRDNTHWLVVIEQALEAEIILRRSVSTNAEVYDSDLAPGSAVHRFIEVGGERLIAVDPQPKVKESPTTTISFLE